MPFVVGVIPARYGSSRLPGKALVDLQGKPLLYHVYKRSCRAKSLSRVIIATDDERIRSAALGFGAEVVITGEHHRSGTDRIFEAVQNVTAEIVVNIQGDEPLIDSRAIDQTVNLLLDDPAADMATLKSPIRHMDDWLNPNIVKVVTDENGYALYFSRSPIPYTQKKKAVPDKSKQLENVYMHVGLYAYRREFLMRFVKWPPSLLEKMEDLEQLRALEHGGKIKVGLIEDHVFGVDTPEDLERIRKLVEGNQKLLDA
jgi:3-deoxy-manno-octulosonate cytidylyltransferase (CMP-KDO synthetase)